MLEWLYKTPLAIAEDSYPDEQENLADLLLRRPELVPQHRLIPIQDIVRLELPNTAEQRDTAF